RSADEIGSGPAAAFALEIAARGEHRQIVFYCGEIDPAFGDDRLSGHRAAGADDLDDVLLRACQPLLLNSLFHRLGQLIGGGNKRLEKELKPDIKGAPAVKDRLFRLAQAV